MNLINHIDTKMAANHFAAIFALQDGLEPTTP